MNPLFFIITLINFPCLAVSLFSKMLKKQFLPNKQLTSTSMHIIMNEYSECCRHLTQRDHRAALIKSLEDTWRAEVDRELGGLSMLGDHWCEHLAVSVITPHV